MPATRKPKKALVQFAIAGIFTLLLCVMAIAGLFWWATNITSQTQDTQKELLKEKEKLEAEKKRLLEEQENLQRTPKTYKVVQAAMDLTPGQAITQEMVSVVSTEERPPAGTLIMLSQAVGSLVKTPIMKGESLEISKLLPKDSFISVKNGMRAITIQVDAIGGLNGALMPGSRVDILTTVQGESGSVTRTLLQNVHVIALGDAPSPAGAPGTPVKPSAAPSTAGIPVTLMVNPREAELLTLANKLGAFHLTLRNFSDTRMDKMSGADLTELMTGVELGGLGKGLPGKPRKPSPADDGFHNVNFSPEAANLPAPDTLGPGKSRLRFTVEQAPRRLIFNNS
jgi:Flp pilus assembly protein CpaB